MAPKTKKIIIILIPIIIVLIIGIVLAILYFTTDFLKSNQTLFLKYAAQNVEAFSTVIDNTDEKEFQEILNQNKYITNSELTAKYTQNANTSSEDTSNDINKLKLAITGQADRLGNYNYKNIDLTYDNNSLFKTEYVQDGNIYGIRLTDIFNQFTSVENNNLKDFAKKLGVTEEQINKIPNTIEEINIEELFSFTKDEIEQLQDKYSNLIINSIPEEKYSKQSNAVITIGETSVNANAYTLTLTKEELNNFFVNMLEQIRDDQIVLNKITKINDTLNFTGETPLQEEFKIKINELVTDIQNNNIGTNEIKFTVYQTNGSTIRTTMESQDANTTVDLQNTDTQVGINITNTTAGDVENNTTIAIQKTLGNAKAELSIKAEYTEGEKTSNIELHRNKAVENSNITVDTGVVINDGNDNNLNISFLENLNLVSEFNRNVVFDDENNIILNNYEAEEIQQVINQIIEQINQKVTENQQIIDNVSKIGNPDTVQPPVEIEETEFSEVEKNRFNSKFEFYTGEEVDGEKIGELVNTAKTDLAGAQVSYSEDETSTSANSKKLQSIRLEIKRGQVNNELADSVLDLVEKNKKYTVSVQYDDNNVVQYITLTINE